MFVSEMQESKTVNDLVGILCPRTIVLILTSA